MISVREDLYEQLKKEDNASGLICNLLDKHFRTSKLTEKQILEQTAINIKEREEREERNKIKIKDFIKQMKDMYKLKICEQDAINYFNSPEFENIDNYAEYIKARNKKFGEVK